MNHRRRMQYSVREQSKRQLERCWLWAMRRIYYYWRTQAANIWSMTSTNCSVKDRLLFRRPNLCCRSKTSWASIFKEISVYSRHRSMWIRMKRNFNDQSGTKSISLNTVKPALTQDWLRRSGNLVVFGRWPMPVDEIHSLSSFHAIASWKLIKVSAGTVAALNEKCGYWTMRRLCSNKIWDKGLRFVSAEPFDFNKVIRIYFLKIYLQHTVHCSTI